MSFRFNAILLFNADAATRGLGKASKGFKKLKTNISKANESLGKISQGIRGAALATAPFTLATGLAVREASNFEAQMSVVQSVLLGTKEDMIGLSDVTKTLGATTVFTAKEAADGAEFLARAGFEMRDIISALPGVLDAAAASGIGLGEAANIVASNIGAFGLEANQAIEVADALALTTALTNTNFTQLGESMKFAAAVAKGAGLSLQQTSSAMGVLANAGIKGSLAGTALKNALLQVSKPSKEVLKLFGGKDGMTQAMIEFDEKGVARLKPIEVIMANAAKAIQGAKNPLEATRQAAEIFGLRGGTAFNAFASQLKRTTVVTDKNLKQLQQGIAKTGENITVQIGDSLPTLVALRLRIAGASGTAKEMSKIRLDNLTGQFTLFKSAISGLAIETGSILTGPLKGIVATATQFFSVMAIGFQAANAGGKATDTQLKSLNNNRFKPLINTMIEFAQGFIEGFNEIKETAKEVFGFVLNLLKPIIGEGKESAKEFGKLVAKIILVGAVAAPVFGAIAAGLFILGPILTGIAGVFGLIGTVFSALGTIASFVLPILIGGFEFLALPIGFAIGVIALLVAGIVGVVKRWDEVKAAFNDRGFLAAVGVFFKSFFLGIVDLLFLPFRALKGFIVGVFEVALSGLGLLGKGILALGKFFIGGDESKIKADGLVPSEPKNTRIVAQTLGVQQESAKIVTETLKQKKIAQAPSADQVGSSVARSVGGAGGAGGGNEINVNVKVQGKIKGNDINLVSTKAQISQSEKNGRQISPTDKRKITQNGSMLPMGAR